MTSLSIARWSVGVSIEKHNNFCRYVDNCQVLDFYTGGPVEVDAFAVPFHVQFGEDPSA